MAKKKKTAPKKQKSVNAKREHVQKSKSSSIEFCGKCGSIMVPIKKGKTSYIKCRSCGREIRKEIKSLKIVEKKSTSKSVIVIEKNTVLLPLTDKECPKCENKRAYWWLQQTRSADEPPTQFFRCEKCKYTWREYR
ncbi:MAG: transcription factor S [Candidatus Aenigmatarchaeota archaeon]